MSWRESIMALVLLAAALFLWQLLKKEEPNRIQDQTAQIELPGYYINGAELIRYDEQGLAQYTILANTIVQNPQNDELNLTNITIEYHDSSSWKVKADKALLPAARDNILFNGNVIASQTETNNKVSFSSESLTYNIKNQQLSTSDWIKAQKGSQLVTAKGMLLDMTNERLQLYSQVKIRFNQ